MPEMDGVEACQIIREKNAHLPIIALTANAMKNDVATYLAGGFNDHVIKPVKANTLYRACIKYLS